MEDKIKILLDKIEFSKENYEIFANSKLSKIIVDRKSSTWTIFIENDNYFPIEVIEELEGKINKLDSNTKNFEIFYNILNTDYSYLINYYPYLLKLLKSDLVVLEIYKECLKYENDKLVLVVSNTIEETKMIGCIDKIRKFYNKFNYEEEIPIIIRKDEHILETIKEELEKSVQIEENKSFVQKEEKKPQRAFKREKDPNSILGRNISDNPIKVKTLIVCVKEALSFEGKEVYTGWISCRIGNGYLFIVGKGYHSL